MLTITVHKSQTSRWPEILTYLGEKERDDLCFYLDKPESASVEDFTETVRRDGVTMAVFRLEPGWYWGRVV